MTRVKAARLSELGSNLDEPEFFFQEIVFPYIGLHNYVHSIRTVGIKIDHCIHLSLIDFVLIELYLISF